MQKSLRTQRESQSPHYFLTFKGNMDKVMQANPKRATNKGWCSCVIQFPLCMCVLSMSILTFCTQFLVEYGLNFVLCGRVTAG